MSLFKGLEQQQLQKIAPLAVRMRPRTLDEFVGQEHFMGAGKLLRRMLEADRLSSAIFYGPPGTGKTTLGHVIAEHTEAEFHQLNAAAVGVREVRQVLEQAKALLGSGGRRTVLFIDELHRFNRAQQDVLLNDVESGLIILLGATTLNPFFTINSPLLSRSQIFQFEPLSNDQVKTLVRRALSDRRRGLGNYDVKISDDALDHLATMSDGDARRALTALEVGVLSQLQEQQDEGRAGGQVNFDLALAAESIQRKAIEYDGTGDTHYDAASAMIKSMRGSDPDAAVYWLARMLEAGEDPRFAARRIAICAAEDVGNADPMALVLANAAVQVSEFVGMPECQLPLAQAAIYIACAEKSNASAVAIWQACDDVRNGRTVPVPKHLRGTGYAGAKRLGHGKDYKYPHSYEGGVVEQDYLGVAKEYYRPTGRGMEARMAEYLEKLKKLRRVGPDQSGQKGAEK